MIFAMAATAGTLTVFDIIIGTLAGQAISEKLRDRKKDKIKASKK